MAIFQSSILGKVKGKVGDLSLYRSNGKQIARVQTSTVKGRTWSTSQEDARELQAQRNLFNCTLYSIPQGEFAPGLRENSFSAFQRINGSSIAAMLDAFYPPVAGLIVLDPQAVPWYYAYQVLLPQVSDSFPVGDGEYNPSTNFIIQKGYYTPKFKILKAGTDLELMITLSATDYAQYTSGLLWWIVVNNTSGIAFSYVAPQPITGWTLIDGEYIAEIVVPTLPAGNIVLVPKVYFKGRRGANIPLMIVQNPI